MVTIHDLTKWETYDCKTIDDCRCNTAKEAYKEAIRLKDVITMGKIIAEPRNKEEVDIYIKAAKAKIKY